MYEWLEKLEAMTREEILDGSKKYCITSTQLGWDFVPERARGALVFDKSEKMFVDFCAGIGSQNTGHNHPQVNNAIRYFLENSGSSLPSHPWPNRYSVGLCKKLCEITPGNFPKKVFLSRGGSEAVSRAINPCLNRMEWDQTFFSFENSFHGRGGALRLHHSKLLHRKKFIRESDLSHAIPFPEFDHSCDMYQNEIVHPKSPWRGLNPGAFFLECVQGEGGLNVGCFTCLPVVVNEFRKLGAIVVADEIQTGLMRTGKMFACEWYAIVPDIIIVGKSLRPGDHLAAYVARAELDYEERGRDSLTGVSAAGCVAALAAIDVLENLDKTALLHKINTLSTVVPEGIGMMRRLRFSDSKIRDEFIKEAWASNPVGLLLLGCGEKNIRIMPPVTINDDELAMGLEILKKILQEIPSL